MTATLSEADSNVIATVSELDAAGTEKVVTAGAVVSAAGGSVIVVAALLDAETLPAASFAQAYSTFAPSLPKVWLAGAEALHPAADADGALALSVTM